MQPADWCNFPVRLTYPSKFDCLRRTPGVSMHAICLHALL